MFPDFFNDQSSLPMHLYDFFCCWLQVLSHYDLIRWNLVFLLFYIFLVSFSCMCSVHACMYGRAWVCGYTWSICLKSSTFSILPCSLMQGLLMKLWAHRAGLSYYPVYFGDPLPLPLQTGIAGGLPHSPNIYMSCKRPKLRFTCVCSKHFSHWAVSPALILYLPRLALCVSRNVIDFREGSMNCWENSDSIAVGRNIL